MSDRMGWGILGTGGIARTFAAAVGWMPSGVVPGSYAPSAVRIAVNGST